MSHPFGDLISQHLHRKHGLSQSKLAEGILQAPTIITGMCKGRRLTGPQARERVVAIIGWLHQQGVLTTRTEADALLNAAGMAGLQTHQPGEAALLRVLPNSAVNQDNAAVSATPTSISERRTITKPVVAAPSPQQPVAPEVTIQNHNLPAQLTPFIGRATEMSKVATLLADPAVRLLTLLGPGGIGKTRLALEVAATQLARFPHGVYFVSLAGVDSGYAIMPLIANALRLALHSEGAPHQQLGEYLHEKTLLLVLDNCEHLIDTVVIPDPSGEAPEVHSFLLLLDLLQAAPQLKILITSRTRLNLQSEQLYVLDGIDFPQEGQTTLLTAQQSSAVALFVQSARALQPDFQLTEQNMAAVVRICRLVQGMPLALLLAAAWVTMLTPAEILAELRTSQDATPSLDFLAADLRDMPARQRSLRAVFDHSWRLLTPEEQAIFTQLALFRGGFTRQAAEEILDFGFSILDSIESPTDSIQNPKSKIQNVLRSLLNKSLIRCRQDQQEQGRYDLHELVRQYAAERLAQTPDKGERVRERHSRFYCELLSAQETRLRRAERKAALTMIELDLGNIRAAWRWALEHPQVAHLPPVVRCLGYFYEARHRYQEAEAAYSMAVHHLQAHPAGTRQPPQRLQLELAKALAWQGAFCSLLGRWRESEQLLQHSLQVLKQSGAAAWMQQTVSAFIFLQLGRLFDMQAKHAESKAYYEPALVHYQAIGEAWGEAHAHLGLGILAYRTVDYAQARQHYEASLALYQRLGDDHGSAQVLVHLGYTFRDQGDFATAQRLTAESIALYERLGDQAAIAHGQLALSWLYLYLGRFHEAYAALEQVSYVFKELRLPSPFMAISAMLAVANLELGRYDQARTQLQIYQAESRSTSQRHELAFGYLLLSLLATVEQRFAEAEPLALEATAYFQELNDLDRWALAVAAQGFAAHGLGKMDISRRCFVAALQSAVDHHSFTSITFALAGVTLTLIAQGQGERAVALYAQLNQLPPVANSQLRWDLAGAQVSAVAATLPPAMVTAAHDQAKTADLWATAAALLAELGGQEEQQQG